MNNIDKLARRIVTTNPKSIFLAQKITGKDFLYSKGEIENIVLAHLRRNNFNDEVIDSIIELHPDKIYFDIFYNRNGLKIATDKDDKGEKLNCAACATFSAEGETQKNPFTGQKVLIFAGLGVISLIIASTFLQTQKS